MTTTRRPRVPTDRVDETGLELPVDDRETSLAAWTNTRMLDDDTADDAADPPFVRGID